MSTGELLTRITIWICILAYAAGVVTFAISRKSGRRDSVTRLIWTIGVAALLAHVACAFHFYHGWSHESAYVETARQTAAVVRLNWGGGLYINYLLLILWTVDVLWWWMGGIDSYQQRPLAVRIVWHGFLVFIIFNATVVFKSGIVSWTGLIVTVVLCVAWIQVLRQNLVRPTSDML